MANVTGLITINGKDIIEVDAVPSAAAGTAAPIGSLALYDTGTVGHVYLKTGAADTAWTELDVSEGQDWELDGNDLTGGSPTAPNEFLGSTNDFDVAFQRNSTEIMRLASQGLLVGLTSSIGGRLQLGVGTLGDEILKQSSPNGGSGAVVAHVTRQYKVQTTDGIQTTLATLATVTDSRMNAYFKIIGNRHGGIAGNPGDGGDYHRTISVKNVSGTVTLERKQTDFTEEDVGGFNVDFSVSGTNILCQVTGDTDNDIAWVAHAEIFIGTN